MIKPIICKTVFGLYNIETVSTVRNYDLLWAKSTTNCGDGMVPYWSASLADKYPNRTFYANNIEHEDLITNSEVLNSIIYLISGNMTQALNTTVSEEMNTGEE